MTVHELQCAVLSAVLVFAFFAIVENAASACVREPVDETSASRTIGTNGFHLEIKDYPLNESLPDPEGYVPGEYYTIKIRGWKTQYTAQTFRGFSLVSVPSDSPTSEQPVGKFQIDQNTKARSSRHCWHAVTQASLHPKTSVSILWQAPKTNKGCIDFKAMVLEYRDIWYMDEAGLTKKFCQLIGYEKMVPNDKARKCCACDEAKYDLIFHGLWSPQSHPKDFPNLHHLTHFSDVIGASHSQKFTMWALNTYATDGMKELAEWGNTYKMEQELKDKAREIRTIIKARGLWYPEVTGTTRAMFRVDKYHHFVSMASMFGPSPDWLVGISSVNLCMTDCTWVKERSFDLYPWDAGTDSGITYMAPNNPSLPREKISDITTKYPDDPRAPFYDAHSNKMPPMARLTLRRENVYSMKCKNDSEYQVATAADFSTSEDLAYKDRQECMVGAWTPWSLCSATCGKGIRMRSRVYKFPIKAQMFNCERQNTEKQFCNAQISICEDSAAFNDDCSVASWGHWTECSVTCGTGIRSRNRNYNDHERAANKRCTVDLEERENCDGPSGRDCSVEFDSRCEMTPWSDWSPCSASCGEGMRVRARLFHFLENQDICSEHSLQDSEPCNAQSCRRFYVRHAAEICAEAMVEGQCGGVFPRYYFDPENQQCRRFIYTGCKGNRNNFETEDQCKQACTEGYDQDKNELVPANQLAAALGVDQEGVNDGGEPVNCMVTGWSPWSECSQTCGQGRRQRTRSIKVFPRNNGRACPPNMVQRRHCRMRPCPTSDCRVSPWSSWSACTVSCGDGVQLRQRRIRYPRGYRRQGLKQLAGSRGTRNRGPPGKCDWDKTERRHCSVGHCRYYWQQ